MKIVNGHSKSLRVGHVDGEWVNGIWKMTGTHVRFPKNSDPEQFWKKYSNKVVRREREVPDGNRYRKYFDYKWTID